MHVSPDPWREIERLYQEAIERDPTDRIAFLERTCPDEHLRKEVESLLEHLQKGDQLFENGPLDTGLHAGARLGPYEIVSPIGSGGMGQVYRARDTRLKRDVAIKTLPDEFSRDPERVARFQREAEVLASLNHPNIAAIYDLQEADGSRFLVLEISRG